MCEDELILDENEMESILCGLEDCRMGRCKIFKTLEKDWKKHMMMADKENRYIEWFRHEQNTKKMIMHFHQELLAPCCVKGLCLFDEIEEREELKVVQV